MIFFTKRKTGASDAEWRFQTVLDIVKDFDRPSFKRFISGIEDAYDGWDKVLRAPTKDEKENKDINDAEKALLETEVK